MDPKRFPYSTSHSNPMMLTIGHHYMRVPAPPLSLRKNEQLFFTSFFYISCYSYFLGYFTYMV